jgi:hypothetical protein
MSSSRQRNRYWKRTAWLFGAASGVFAVATAATSTVMAQNANYQSAATAPASWQLFGKQLRDHFEERLAADDKEARAFEEYVVDRVSKPNPPPQTFVAQAWVLPNGRIERLEFDGLDDDIAMHLRSVLTRDNVGAPPADMIQPLRLRLSLRQKEQRAGEK